MNIILKFHFLFTFARVHDWLLKGCVKNDVQAQMLKKNIGQFSGFVWSEQEVTVHHLLDI